jgi:hypothetical protein
VERRSAVPAPPAGDASGCDGVVCRLNLRRPTNTRSDHHWIAMRE